MPSDLRYKHLLSSTTKRLANSVDSVDDCFCRVSFTYASRFVVLDCIMALAGAPLTPDSQYITLMSTASIDSFPNNTSSNFTTRFDPPLELRGGNFNVALMEIFHPTKWINIAQDKYYVGYELREKVYHDPKYIDPATYLPDRRPQQDAPDDSSSSASWTSWWRGTTAEERQKAREEAEERDIRKRRNWTEKNGRNTESQGAGT